MYKDVYIHIYIYIYMYLSILCEAYTCVRNAVLQQT